MLRPESNSEASGSAGAGETLPVFTASVHCTNAYYCYLSYAHNYQEQLKAEKDSPLLRNQGKHCDLLPQRNQDHTAE
jgi:hypothetical protein